MFCVIAEIEGILELWSEHETKNEALEVLNKCKRNNREIGFSLHINQKGVFYEVH